VGVASSAVIGAFICVGLGVCVVGYAFSAEGSHEGEGSAACCAAALTLGREVVSGDEGGISGQLRNTGSEVVEYGSSYDLLRRTRAGRWKKVPGVYVTGLALTELQPSSRTRVSFAFPRRSPAAERSIRLRTGRYRIRTWVRCPAGDNRVILIGDFKVKPRTRR
jgi:hypothetical protein